jgi:hypothetical protein
MGWYRPVHRKSVSSQEVRALLAARKQMQIKAMDVIRRGKRTPLEG